MSKHNPRKSFIQYELPAKALKEVQGGRPDRLTTMAVGEECGDIIVTTMAVGEEGGGQVTSLAVGEETGC